MLDWLHRHDVGEEGGEESKRSVKNGLARRSAKWGKQLLAAMAGKGEDGTEMATAGNLESLRKELTEEQYMYCALVLPLLSAQNVCKPGLVLQ